MKKKEYRIILTENIDRYNLKKGEIYYTEGLERTFDFEPVYYVWCEGQKIEIKYSEAEIVRSIWYKIKYIFKAYFSVRCKNCKYYEITDSL